MADVMGLGKTLQMLALIADRKPPDSNHLPVLVVAPLSVSVEWVNEIQKHTSNITYLDF